MFGRLIIVVFLHFSGLAMFLIPVRFKGPVLFLLAGLPFRTLDIAAIIVIFLGTTVLWYIIIKMIKGLHDGKRL